MQGWSEAFLGQCNVSRKHCVIVTQNYLLVVTINFQAAGLVLVVCEFAVGYS